MDRDLLTLSTHILIIDIGTNYDDYDRRTIKLH